MHNCAPNNLYYLANYRSIISNIGSKYIPNYERRGKMLQSDAKDDHEQTVNDEMDLWFLVSSGEWHLKLYSVHLPFFQSNGMRFSIRIMKH